MQPTKKLLSAIWENNEDWEFLSLQAEDEISRHISEMANYCYCVNCYVIVYKVLPMRICHTRDRRCCVTRHAHAASFNSAMLACRLKSHTGAE